MEDAFVFDDYTNEELLQALEMKMKQADLSATDAAKKVAIDVLDRARSRPRSSSIWNYRPGPRRHVFKSQTNMTTKIKI